MNQEFVQTNKYHIKRRRRLDDSAKLDLLDLIASDDGICNLTNLDLTSMVSLHGALWSPSLLRNPLKLYHNK